MPYSGEVLFAKELYEQCSRLRNWSLATSPVWRFGPEAQSELPAIGSSLARIDASVVKTSDPLVWTAPSAWHAALYCQMLQHHRAFGGSRFLFRGQRNTAWPLVPALSRDRARLERESLRGLMFSKLLSAMSFNTMVNFHPHSSTNVYLRMGPHSYIAAAQHYGIATALMDFTSDPDIAVKFACSGDASNGDFASVYILPLETIEGGEFTVILPPPFIKRLYRQRGIFVLSGGALDKSQLFIVEIRFPASNDFEVMREHAVPLDIMPPEQGLAAVVRAADEIVDGKRGENEIVDLARSLKSEITASSDPFKNWFEYVDVFEDVLYALVYSFDESDNLTIDTQRFESIVRGNKEVSCSIASLYRAAPRYRPDAFSPDKIRFMAMLADQIDAIALRDGYDHKQEADSYASSMLGTKPTFT